MWTLFAKTEKYGEVCFPSSEFPNSKDNGQMYIAIFTVKFLPFFPLISMFVKSVLRLGVANHLS